MLAKFRQKYPQGSLVSDLIEIDRGIYIVQASVKIDNIVLVSALASANTVEAADDAAKQRAIATLFLDSSPSSDRPQPKSSTPLSLSKSTDAPVAEPGTVKETKIVDFAQPRAEEPKPTNISLVQDLSLASSAEPTETHAKPELESENFSAAPRENNLFGDTFEAEIPETITALEVSSDNVAELDAMDFNEIKQKTDIEIKRLGWSKDRGKEFLMSHYGKRSRLHLTDEQLLEFLRYLEKLPNPVK